MDFRIKVLQFSYVKHRCKCCAKCEVLTAALMKIQVFWESTPCTLTYIYIGNKVTNHNFVLSFKIWIFTFTFLGAFEKFRKATIMSSSCLPVCPYGTSQLPYLLTYSMEQSPSWEANWFCSWSRNSPHF